MSDGLLRAYTARGPSGGRFSSPFDGDGSQPRRGERSESDERAALAVLRVTDAAVRSYTEGRPVSLEGGNA